jgi:DNA-directed RNA polymerase specialized sigma24 family protein
VHSDVNAQNLKDERTLEKIMGWIMRIMESHMHDHYRSTRKQKSIHLCHTVRRSR